MGTPRILARGPLEGRVFDSRVTTRAMTLREKVLGHLVGPLGMIVFFMTVSLLVELYYTSVVPVDSIYGEGTYLTIAATTRAVGIAFGIGMGWVVDRTVSRQGRIRPYVFMASVLMLVSGVALFWIPDIGAAPRLVWIFAAQLAFNAIGMTAYLLRVHYITLTTRSVTDRVQIATLSRVAQDVIAGTLVGLVLASILYYSLLANDKTGVNWITLVVVVAIVAAPLMLTEFYYTKERVTEENREANAVSGDREIGVPLRVQLKSLFTNKNWILALIILTAVNTLNVFRGGNVQVNFIQWVLGGDESNGIPVLFLVLSGAPLGIGAIVVVQLARRFSTKSILIVSYLLILGGVGVGLIAPYSVPLAIAANFIIFAGKVATLFLLPALLGSVADSVEERFGYRIEGALGAAIVAGSLSVVQLPFAGLYESLLMSSGYDAFASGGQSGATNLVILASWYGSDFVFAAISVIALAFFTLERELPRIQSVLIERRRAAVLASGGTWTEPDEVAASERAASEAAREADRVADLRDRCERRGLDFETQNTKYLARKERLRSIRRKIGRKSSSHRHPSSVK